MNARTIALALTAALTACSAGGSGAASVPLGAVGESASAARTANVEITFENVPSTMRSIGIEAAIGVFVQYTNLDLTPTSAGCSRAAGKTTCKVAAKTYVGATTMTATGYAKKAQNGTRVFQAEFEVTGKKSATVDAVVPLALYLHYYALHDGNPAYVTNGPSGDSHVWFTYEDFNGKRSVVSASTTTGAMKFYAEPIVQGSANAYNSIAAGPNSTLWYNWSDGIGINNFMNAITTAGAARSYATTLTASCTNTPESVASGPDGNAWFTELTCGGSSGNGGAIGKIAPNGTITNYLLPVDKNDFQEFTLNVNQHEIAAGADGAMYALASMCVLAAGACSSNEVGAVIRITTAGSMQFFPLKGTTCTTGYLVPGGDGNVWVVLPCVAPVTGPKPSYYGNTIVRVTPAGKQTYFYGGFGAANGIGEGPDGNLYLTDQGGTIRFVTQGSLLAQSVEYPHDDVGITGAVSSGPDGNLWVTAIPGPYGTQGFLEKIQAP
jgi:streptogramin lyase